MKKWEIKEEYLTVVSKKSRKNPAKNGHMTREMCPLVDPSTVYSDLIKNILHGRMAVMKPVLRKKKSLSYTK